MIELNRIRSMKTLEDLKKDLSNFINFDRSALVAIYADEYGWGEEDLDADLDQSTELLEQVERRMKSLGHHLSRTVKVKNVPPQSDAKGYGTESQVPS
jgi:hypothetical protein